MTATAASCTDLLVNDWHNQRQVLVGRLTTRGGTMTADAYSDTGARVLGWFFTEFGHGDIDGHDLLLTLATKFDDSSVLVVTKPHPPADCSFPGDARTLRMHPSRDTITDTNPTVEGAAK